MLDNETCIILIDFVENYSFLVQDAIQSFYWQNQQATLHPFEVYYNDDDGKLKCGWYCVIWDYLLHDLTAVHCFISLVIPTICTKNPRINRIKYCSNGAASQPCFTTMNMILILKQSITSLQLHKGKAQGIKHHLNSCFVYVSFMQWLLYTKDYLFP